MKTHKENFVPTFEVTPVKDESLAAFAQRLQDISTSANDLRSQLALYADTLDDKGLQRQAEALRTWMDINQEGLAVAAHVAELGADWAEETQARLEAAANDLRGIAGAGNSEAGSRIGHICDEVNEVLDSMEVLYRPSAGILGQAEKLVEPAPMFMR